MSIKHKVLIIGTQRCGSTITEELIKNSTVIKHKEIESGIPVFSNLGEPGEFLNFNIDLLRVNDPQIQEYYSIDTLNRIYIDRLNFILNRPENTPVVTRLMMLHTVNDYKEMFRLAQEKNFTLLYVNRLDKLAQIRSHIISMKTDQWYRPTESNHEKRYIIDQSDVDFTYHWLNDCKRLHKEVFDFNNNGGNVHVINYETLVDDLNRLGFNILPNIDFDIRDTTARLENFDEFIEVFNEFLIDFK
jgi:LPS sulfotransferase NodH